MKKYLMPCVSVMVCDFICPNDIFSRLECSDLFILYFDRKCSAFLIIVTFALDMSDYIGMFF